MALPSSSTPPLLLTKRLAAFLHANQSPQLPTLLLTTAHGKILAHASPQPVTLLRTHATVAASLFAIHTSSSVALPSALPGARSPDPVASPPPARALDRDDGLDTEDDDDEEDEEEDDVEQRGRDGADVAPRSTPHPVKPSTITVQLSGGTVVIRLLKCGLLFVCVGPAAQTSSTPSAAASSTNNPPTSNPSAVDQPEQTLQSPQQPLLQPQHALLHASNGDIATSPSDAGSMLSAGAQTTVSLESSAAASAVSLRRHAAELARWLDDKLGTLKVPEEGVGME